MAGVVEWLPDGTPRSPHYGDVYRSRGTDGLGGLAQARHVFLRGCGLLPEGSHPPVWAGAARWHVLENGFGLGLNFLATWQAWLEDPAAPPQLFYTGIEAHPCDAEDIRRSAAPFAALQPLAQRLAAAWRGLLPGVHRWTWTDAGPHGAPRTLHLTLAVGEAAQWLPALDAAVDSVFLDGFAPARNPAMWAPEVLRAAVRLCRRGARLATWSVARSVREALAAAGCRLTKAPGLPPKRECLRAVFDPPWQPRRTPRGPLPAGTNPGRAAVVGGGLAGAAAAFSLAQRGWRVTVLDRAAQPAAGASGLPVGLLAPHTSPDDAPLSRLTRAGLSLTRQRAQALLTEGQDWSACGVLEHRLEDKHALPPAERWGPWGKHWSRHAQPDECSAASLAPEVPALWHAAGGWLRPARLVQAQLQAAGAAWRGNTAVAALQAVASGGWRLLDEHGLTLLEADLVVLAAGYATRALLGAQGAQVPLHALRGQVAWAPMATLPASAAAAMPPFPVNGHGSLVAGVPAGPRGEAVWCMGSTFVRGRTDTLPTQEEHAANRTKLQRLLPVAADALAPHWDTAHAWAGVRCTLPDRFPAVGAIDPQRLAGLCVLTGLGARGLTLSVLGGEVLAAELHGEPWPLEPVLAARMLARRFGGVAAQSP